MISVDVYRARTAGVHGETEDFHLAPSLIKAELVNECLVCVCGVSVRVLADVAPFGDRRVQPSPLPTTHVRAAGEAL